MADSDPVGGGCASCGNGPVEGSFAFEEGSSSSKKKKSWIAIKLVDEEGKPVPDEEYRIVLPDGTTIEGDLNKWGFACVRGIDPGTCQVTFPGLDMDIWWPKG